MHALHKFLLFHVLTCLGQNACGITNGEKAPRNSMLYMASLQTNTGKHRCGGFLVSEDFVMTSAVCDDPRVTRVVLGTNDLTVVDNGNIRYIQERYKYPSYVTPGKGKDIMLLKLSEKVRLDNNSTIQIPTSEININDNSKCRVAGWGKTTTGGGAVDELRVVDVSIINLEVCEKQWPGLPANVTCAGGYDTNKGFCQGDSGGPLVCDGKAVGVVSFNFLGKCDYPHKPNVYTDISKYLPWINSVLHDTKNMYIVCT